MDAALVSDSPEELCNLLGWHTFPGPALLLKNPSPSNLNSYLSFKTSWIPKSETLNPKPQTLSPKLQPLNPKPQTLNH